MTGTLILLRHGESEWNAKNLFTGWVDVDLNAKGEAEVSRGGELLVENNLLPDVVHTSVLRRAIRTAQISLDIADRLWIETKAWAAQRTPLRCTAGQATRPPRSAEFGEEQFMLWRRSYDIPPPHRLQRRSVRELHDPKYAGLPDRGTAANRTPKHVPDTCAAVSGTTRRARPVGRKGDADAAHGNSLRAIVKQSDQMTDEAVVGSTFHRHPGWWAYELR
jgi:2,3-bisphosphoglycerate-dependent phosphoglycerate mutase